MPLPILLMPPLVLAMTQSDLSRLVTDLSDSVTERRIQAAEALSQMGEQAQAAAVSLVGACGDPDEAVRELAVAALEDLGPPRPADIEPLARLLGHATADVAYWAATLLGRLQADAAPAVPALKSVLASTAELAVRQRAAWALGQIGPKAADALAELRAAAADQDPRLARLAAEAIQQIQR